jgi:hypothetical protein
VLNNQPQGGILNRPRSAPAPLVARGDWNDNGGFFGWGWGSQSQYGNSRDPRQNGQYYQQQNGQYYQQQNGQYYDRQGGQYYYRQRW